MPRRRARQPFDRGMHSDQAPGSDWQDYRQSSPASASFYARSDNSPWRQHQPDSLSEDSLAETWVLWCDELRVLREMVKVGASDTITGRTRIRRPYALPDESFFVDMCSLLPYDWDLVNTRAPNRFNRSSADDDDETSSEKSVGSRDSNAS